MASNAQVLAELAEMRKAYALLVEAGQAKPTKVGPELIELKVKLVQVPKRQGKRYAYKMYVADVYVGKVHHEARISGGTIEIAKVA